MPRLTINLFSGGKHAGRQVAIQDVLIVPARPTTIDESLAMAYDVYQAAAALILKRYSMRLLTADEGGLAPAGDSTEELIEMAVVAIKSAGYRPGADVMLAMDVAASRLLRHGHLSPGRCHARQRRDDRKASPLGGTLSHRERGRRPRGGRLGMVAHAAAGTGEARTGSGRRLTLHESGAHPARHRGAAPAIRCC